MDSVYNYLSPQQLNNLLYILTFVIMIVSVAASSNVTRIYKKHSSTPSRYGFYASAVAEQLLAKNSSAVRISEVGGALTDHFNPKTQVVGLSQAVYHNNSVAALAIAAHEIGHVMQYEENYTPIKIRNTILPVAQFGSQAAPWLILGGLLIGMTDLAMVGVLLYGAMLLFQVVTLPVEFNASRRAIAMLSGGGYIAQDEEAVAKKVLRAAAMTYVLAALSSLVTFLRLLLIVNNRRK
ncbi:MAG: zinc metallopeptidase [Clostridia bacterium]|nr:zinc metallopeptidase [Clostridia bacterium]